MMNIDSGLPKSWEEWNGLNEEQRRYSLFKILQTISGRFGVVDKHCFDQAENCEKRFKKIESRKYWNPIASMVGGVMGGFIAVVAKWTFWSG